MSADPLQEAENLKLDGSRFFQVGNAHDALMRYKKALDIVKHNRTESNVIQWRKLFQSLNLNIALCYTKQKHFSLAVDSCNEVLSFDPSNAKAVFRRGVAYMHMKNFAQALIDLELAYAQLPDDAGVKAALDRLRLEMEQSPGSSSVLSNSSGGGQSPPFERLSPPTTGGEQIMFKPTDPSLDPMQVLSHMPFYMAGQIPRVKFSHLNSALEIMRLEQPVIIEGASLIKPAVEKWTLEYLKEHMGDEASFDVFTSKGDSYFLYHDESKNQVHDSFLQFKKSSDSLSGGGEPDKVYVYLQQVLNEGVGSKIVEDFKMFDWAWLQQISSALKFGPLKFNTLWIGEKGVTTKTHYDEAFNLFGQVSGRKLFVLFDPDSFSKLYPYPVHHAHDRQAQVDIDKPDFTTFPKFAEARGMAGIVGPGDLLYLPPYWFHYVRSLEQTTSINFWFRIPSPNSSDIKFPLSASQKTAVRRNIEKMLGETVGPENVGTFLTELTAGRWDNLS